MNDAHIPSVVPSANPTPLDPLLRQLDRIDGLLRQHVLMLFRHQQDTLEDYLRAPSRTEVIATGRASTHAENATTGDLLLDRLVARFALTPFQKDVLLLGLLPYFDTRVQAVFSFAHGQQLKRLPSFDLALSLFCPTPFERSMQHDAFNPHSPLLKHQLLSVAKAGEPAGENWHQSSFMTDVSVCRYLTGQRALSAQLQHCAEWLTEHAPWCPEPVASAMETMRTHAPDGKASPPVLMLRGARDTGRAAAVCTAASALQCGVLQLDLAQLPENDKDALQACIQALREARMHGACLLLRSLEDFQEKRRTLFATLARQLQQPGLMVVCLCEMHPPALPQVHQLLVDMPSPTLQEKETLLRSTLTSVAATHLDVPSLCRSLHFTRANLSAIVEEAGHYRTLRDPGSALTVADLYKASRLHAQQDFGKLAKRIEPKRTLDDLVVPVGLRQQLHEIVIATRQRQAVLEKGFGAKISYGTGISALFHGDSGTGKTMAAEAIAHHLGVALIRVDLASVVSKYIGETEKNLCGLFDLARTDTGVLFFDEADALFGKRTTVKDAKDRHANIEVSYLLQRLEEHPGLILLSTNNRGALDEAFSRRFTFIARFAFPDVELRERLWRSIWPQAVRIGNDVDFASLAQRAQLTGANIRNIALLATWLAEDERAPSVGRKHIDLAFKRELGKLGRLEL